MAKLVVALLFVGLANGLANFGGSTCELDSDYSQFHFIWHLGFSQMKSKMKNQSVSEAKGQVVFLRGGAGRGPR